MTATYTSMRIPSLVIRPKAGVPKERRFVGLSGWRGPVRLGVHNHNLTNVLRALTERVYYVSTSNGLQPPPKPAKHAYERLNPLRKRLLRHCHCRPWSRDEFILSYKGAKQQRMRQAVETLSLRGVQRTDAHLRTFVKAEKVNTISKPDSTPRPVQPRTPEYNAAVGPYLKAAEHPIYAALAELWGGPTVMKGYNGEQVAGHIVQAWGEFNSPVAIGLDASRFDQHVSKDCLEFEHSVYNQLFNSAELREWLTWQVKNIGKAYTPDGVVSYLVEACRMSGDMNTALGNCLIMCLLVLLMVEESKVRARLINNGDDCTLILEKADLYRLPNIKKWFLKFGFNMKQEPTVSEIEHIEFCQMHPVFDGTTWVMCRSPTVGMMKDLTNIRPQVLPDGSIDVKSFRTWCHAVGTGGMRLAGGVPIFQSHYSAMIRFGQGSKSKLTGFGDRTTGFEHLFKGMGRTPTTVTDAARYSFWKAFGIIPDMQIAIEEHIDSIESWRVNQLTTDTTNIHIW